MNNLSNLWISAYWRREPFQTIQLDLVNWFDRFTKKIRLSRTIRSRIGHHYKKDADGQDRCYGADPAENETPSYSAEVELKGNEVNPWPYLCSIMQCKLCLPRP